MPAIVVGAPRSYSDRGWSAVSSTIEIDGRRLDIYYRVSQGALAISAAPFALNVLSHAMKTDQPLHIETPLSPAALSLLLSAQTFIKHGHPELHDATVEATPLPTGSQTASTQHDRRGVGLFFSGGVDSFYSLLKHQDEITHLVFVHGFDTLLENPGVRQRNVRAMRQAAAELGKPLIEVETNVRSQLDALDRWSHRAAIALTMAIAQVLGLQLRKVYVAENFDYFGRWAMDDILHGFTTGGAGVFLDGTDCLRLDKTAFVTTSDIAMRWLRVCWQNQEHLLNCGHCEKCVRTMLALHLAGALSRCRTFDRPLDLERIRSLRLGQFGYFWPEMLLELERSGDQPALTEAVRDSVGWATIPPNIWSMLLTGLEKRGDHPELLRFTCERLAETQATGLPRETAERLSQAVIRSLNLQTELHVIKSSQSWKLTAPLRNARVSLRQLLSAIR